MIRSTSSWNKKSEDRYRLSIIRKKLIKLTSVRSKTRRTMIQMKTKNMGK